MHDTPIRVDHVGIAVESVDGPESVLRALGCEKLSDEAVTEGGSVPVDAAPEDAVFRWAYYRLGDASRIELVAPIADDTFLTRYLERHGPGLHHVTLEVADLDAVTEALEAEGVRVVDRQEYPDWTEAFVSPTNPTGALFQLMEYHPDYDVERSSREELYVNGAPVGEAEP